ncbi:hypothetical protein [Streptosporangium sp. NBC_01469]|uniref:hypothetical protein n=1 Tax=Streptosporangium sp. NBC_01469 TaxID=2903898 RepID=UPI002E2B6284|nr:hypothetical protein [Streptosporangium sp. NBC_01469]
MTPHFETELAVTRRASRRANSESTSAYILRQRPQQVADMGVVTVAHRPRLVER